jgi:hypothetical protein
MGGATATAKINEATKNGVQPSIPVIATSTGPKAKPPAMTEA